MHSLSITPEPVQVCTPTWTVNCHLRALGLSILHKTVFYTVSCALSRVSCLFQICSQVPEKNKVNMARVDEEGIYLWENKKGNQANVS